MLCPKCGQYNPEGVACPCGAPLLSSNPAVNVLKTLGSSGRFLTMAILATAIPLCAILAASGMSNMLAQLLYLLWERSAMDTDTFYQLAGMIQGMGVMSAVWASVPSILAALGLWLFYASCRNRKTGNVSTAGLTILKVLAYIFAIYVGICALFLVVCAIFVPFLVLSGAEVTYNGSPVDGTGAGVIVALVIFVFARGELVDEAALEEAMASGKVAAYATDFPTDSQLGRENVVALPHLGASTPESEDNCAVMAVDQLKDYLENGNIKNSVNLPALSMSREPGTRRICLIHKNIPNTIATFTTTCGEAGINIENMQSKSRGEYAYTVLDVSGDLTPQAVDSLKALAIKVRVID